MYIYYIHYVAAYTRLTALSPRTRRAPLCVCKNSYDTISIHWLALTYIAVGRPVNVAGLVSVPAVADSRSSDVPSPQAAYSSPPAASLDAEDVDLFGVLTNRYFIDVNIARSTPASRSSPEGWNVSSTPF